MDVYAITKSNQALGAATAETVLQVVAAATVRPQVTSITIAFDGTSSTAEPVDVFLVTQDTAGTSSAATVGKLDPAAPAAQTTGRLDFTAEPTTDSNEIWRTMIHPQGGIYEKNWVIGDPTAPKLNVSTRLGLKMNAPAAVNCSATIQFAE